MYEMTQLNQLFEYIEKNGAKEIYKQDAILCEKYKDIINKKINEYLIHNPQKKANIFEICLELSEEDFDLTLSTDENLQLEIPDAIHEAFNNWTFKTFMRKGDILINNFTVLYREKNDGKLLFDGEKLVGLSTKFNDYGHVSDNFLVFTEFPPNYWDNLSYDGTLTVFVDFSKIQYKRTDENIYEITFNNKKYKIISETNNVQEGIVAIYNDGDNEFEYYIMNNAFEYIIDETD